MKGSTKMSFSQGEKAEFLIAQIALLAC